MSAGRCSCTAEAPGARRRSARCRRCWPRAGPAWCRATATTRGCPPGRTAATPSGCPSGATSRPPSAYAVEQGAREVLLMGWSMGGAIVLQLLDRSPLSALVSRVVLDAPVIDWGDVLAHHAREHRVPRTRRVAGARDDAAAVGPPARRRARGRRPGQDRLGAARRRAAPPGAAHPQRRRRVRARAARRASWPGPGPTWSPSRSGTSPGTARSGTPSPSAGSASSATSRPADRRRRCQARVCALLTALDPPRHAGPVRPLRRLRQLVRAGRSPAWRPAAER